jgi:hypothetical protein
MILRRAKAHSSTNNWSQIAANIPGRCGKQCRERWTTILDPQFKHTAWTAEEDTTLLDCHTRVGNQWSIIAKSLPGRSQVRVRDRYKKLCRNGKVTLDTEENQAPRTVAAKPEALPTTQRTTAFTRYDNEALNHLDLCFVLCGMRNQVEAPVMPPDPSAYQKVNPHLALTTMATQAYHKAAAMAPMGHGGPENYPNEAITTGHATSHWA